jgi:hypothetical protein
MHIRTNLRQESSVDAELRAQPLKKKNERAHHQCGHFMGI